MPRRRPLLAVAILLLLLLMAFLISQQVRERMEATPAPHDAQPGATLSPKSKESRLEFAETDPDDDPAKEFQQEVVVVRGSGFLCRGPDGLHLVPLEPPKPPDLGEGEPLDPAVAIDRLAPSPLLTPFPAGATRDFFAFLRGEAGTTGAPRSLLELEAEHVRIRVYDPDRPADAPPAPDVVKAVRSSQVLPEDWLLAWRDMYAAAVAILRDADSPARQSKKADLITAAERLAAAWDAARAAPGLGAWRERAEANCLDDAVPVLRTFALRDSGPSWPLLGEALPLLARSPTPAEFRRRVVDLWGERSVCSTAETGEGHSLLEITRMTPSEYLEVRARAPKAVPEGPPPETTTWAGMTFVDLTSQDSARSLVTQGARVSAVDPESAAATAGVQVGDVVRTCRIEYLQKAGEESPAKPFELRILGASDMTDGLGSEGEDCVLILGIVRGWQEVEVRMQMK